MFVKRLFVLIIFFTLVLYGLYNIFSCRLLNMLVYEVEYDYKNFSSVKCAAYMSVIKKFPHSIGAKKAKSRMKFIVDNEENYEFRSLEEALAEKKDVAINRPARSAARTSNNQKTSYTSVTQSPRWPWTSHRRVTLRDIQNLSKAERRLMRNEIYARHGWIFKSADLQNYFNNTNWYKPAGNYSNRSRVNERVAQNISELEKTNADFIKRYE